MLDSYSLRISWIAETSFFLNRFDGSETLTMVFERISVSSSSSRSNRRRINRNILSTIESYTFAADNRVHSQQKPFLSRMLLWGVSHSGCRCSPDWSPMLTVGFRLCRFGVHLRDQRDDGARAQFSAEEKRHQRYVDCETESLTASLSAICRCKASISSMLFLRGPDARRNRPCMRSYSAMFCCLRRSASPASLAVSSISFLASTSSTLYMSSIFDVLLEKVQTEFRGWESVRSVTWTLTGQCEFVIGSIHGCMFDWVLLTIGLARRTAQTCRSNRPIHLYRVVEQHWWYPLVTFHTTRIPITRSNDAQVQTRIATSSSLVLTETSAIRATAAAWSRSLDAKGARSHRWPVVDLDSRRIAYSFCWRVIALLLSFVSSLHLGWLKNVHSVERGEKIRTSRRYLLVFRLLQL